MARCKWNLPERRSGSLGAVNQRGICSPKCGDRPQGSGRGKPRQQSERSSVPHTSTQICHIWRAAGLSTAKQEAEPALKKTDVPNMPGSATEKSTIVPSLTPGTEAGCSDKNSSVKEHYPQHPRSTTHHLMRPTWSHYDCPDHKCNPGNPAVAERKVVAMSHTAQFSDQIVSLTQPRHTE